MDGWMDRHAHRQTDRQNEEREEEIHIWLIYMLFNELCQT
jgi:hypothetical protein